MTEILKHIHLLLVLGTFITFLSLSNLDIAYASHLEINTTKLIDNMYAIHGLWWKCNSFYWK